MPTETWWNLPSEKRERVTRAAMIEFGKRGFSAGSLNVIAREADIAKGSLFQYFDDKLDMFTTISEAGVETIRDAALDGIDVENDEFFPALRHIVRNWLTFFSAHPIERGFAYAADIEAVLAVTTRDMDAVVHTVPDEADALFTWDYEKGAQPGLSKLYEKAKTSQWNGSTDLDWSTDVDPERVCAEMHGADYRTTYLRRLSEQPGSPVANWGDKEWTAYTTETFLHRVSQFMHGEQGALLCTAKIVETVPWIDAKYYAATQVVDEARHVEVFSRYLDTKLEGHYPINAHLRMLLDDIIRDSRWDMTYLGMQIMVEGLALAAFGFMHKITTEPLLKRQLRYVMSEEV